MHDDLTWRKSKRCASNACVEVATGHPAGVAVRDSEDRDGPVIVFDRDAWAAFTASL